MPRNGSDQVWGLLQPNSEGRVLKPVEGFAARLRADGSPEVRCAGPVPPGPVRAPQRRLGCFALHVYRSLVMSTWRDGCCDVQGP